MESIQGHAIPDRARDVAVLGPEKTLGSVLSSRSGSTAKIARTIKDVTRLGTHQSDLWWPNVLWNEELSRVMMIEFEFGRLEDRKPSVEIVTGDSTNPSLKREGDETAEGEVAGAKRMRATRHDAQGFFTVRAARRSQRGPENISGKREWPMFP
ncbi:MAG: hypothetical protein M1816_003893 [Peltula sp. TS41687]|nr:MAG: hypothetical protein M1816_003893 [Peltula sp. TS41687]